MIAIKDPDNRFTLLSFVLTVVIFSLLSILGYNQYPVVTGALGKLSDAIHRPTIVVVPSALPKAPPSYPIFRQDIGACEVKPLFH